MYMLMDCLFIYFILVVMVLLGIGFFTLLERKVLGYGQMRKGPNKVGIVGLFQPIADGMKLFLKEFEAPMFSNWLLFMLTPLIGFVFSLILWLIFPCKWYWFDFIYSLLFFFCVSSFGVYFIVGGGWFSNSKYAMLGSYRAVAQMISYEVGMIMIIMSLVFYECGYMMMVDVGGVMWFSCGYFFLFLMWMICCLAETNRSPMDFAEAESELVSGFNVEYGAGSFALIFMSEYGNIMLMCIVSMVYFFGGGMVMFYLLMIYFLWVRVTFPRMRYDKLMSLVWKVYLPCSLNFLIFVVGLCFMSC